MSEIKLMSHLVAYTVLFCYLDALHCTKEPTNKKQIVLLYQVFLSISSHGQWSVGDLVCLVLERFKGHGGCSAPLFALYDRFDAALLVCGVGHGEGLCVRASYWANKIHHLETSIQKEVRIMQQLVQRQLHYR